MAEHHLTDSTRRHRHDGEPRHDEVRQQRRPDSTRRHSSHRDEDDQRSEGDDKGDESSHKRSRSSYSGDRGGRDGARQGSSHHAKRHRHDIQPADGDEPDDASNTSSPSIHPRLSSAGLKPLTEEDYYSQSIPFRYWLLNARKPKRLNDLSTQESHSLFKKFVDKFNRGRLDDVYYLNDGSGITSQSLATMAAGQTSYRWGFIDRRSKKEEEEVELLRDGVDSLTNGMSKGAREKREREMKSVSRKRRGDGQEDGDDIGPSLPPPRLVGPTVPGRSSHPTDVRLAAEEASESSHRQATAQRRAERRDAKDLREELNPRATGRDAIIEKRREANRANRDFEASRGAVDVELPEEVLMGGGGSFQEALAAHHRSGRHSDGPRSKAQEAREVKRMEKEQELESRRQAFKAKEDGTMAMLRELAKSRFG